jgi:hypothetical protein
MPARSLTQSRPRACARLRIGRAESLTQARHPGRLGLRVSESETCGGTGCRRARGPWPRIMVLSEPCLGPGPEPSSIRSGCGAPTDWMAAEAQRRAGGRADVPGTCRPGKCGGTCGSRGCGAGKELLSSSGRYGSSTRKRSWSSGPGGCELVRDLKGVPVCLHASPCLHGGPEPTSPCVLASESVTLPANRVLRDSEVKVSRGSDICR